MLVPLLALVFFCMVVGLRMHRVAYLSGVGDAPSATESWRPRLIVPGHHNETFEWLDQTLQMFAKGEWRVRHVDYENAPAGHDVSAASPYRWWLGLVALARHDILGTPIGPSVEWAALVADPLLLLILGAGAVVFAARRFGIFPAVLLSAGLATWFPFASEFVPGAPDDRGLVELLALWSILPLLAVVSAADSPGGLVRRRRGFLVSGVIGGIALWISVPGEFPILVGVAIGGLLAALVLRVGSRNGPVAPVEPLPWRAWAVGGSITCLCAYLAEFFPGHLGSWELRTIHPVYGLAWLGGGEVLARLAARIQSPGKKVELRGWAALALGILGLAFLPAAMVFAHSSGFFVHDLSTIRLSILPESAAAPSLWAWLLQNGFTLAVVTTLLPLVMLVPAVVILVLRVFGPEKRAALCLALGPALVALGFAFRELSWWNGLDSALLALSMMVVATLHGSARKRLVVWSSASVAAVIGVLGAIQLWPSAGSGGTLMSADVIGLVERDLAYWLSQHVGQDGAIVLAPPNATTALYYYGGIRGLGTFDWESRDGIRAAVRIVSALTPEEAQELINGRGITHIVIPVWDPYLDAYARVGEGQVGSTFLERLHLWVLPRWLRPVPYLIPSISGFEGQSVAVMEVVDEQDDATAASRLAEYFIAMGQMDLASNAGIGLRRFPADLGALLARTEIAIAQNDSDEFSRTFEVLLRRINGGADQALPWDQQVGLAIVLAQAHHVDLARIRLKKCVDEIDEEKLRLLSTNSLYRFQVLRRALGMEIKDPRLRDEAMDLLPADLRERLRK
jgi:hypothetical protein